MKITYQSLFSFRPGNDNSSDGGGDGDYYMKLEYIPGMKTNR